MEERNTPAARVPRDAESARIVDAAIERAESLLELRRVRAEFSRRYREVETFRRDVLYPAIVRADRARAALASLDRDAGLCHVEKPDPTARRLAVGEG